MPIFLEQSRSAFCLIRLHENVVLLETTFSLRTKFVMSIYSTVLALSLTLHPTADNSFGITNTNSIGQPSLLAQIALDQYDDGIKANREELNRLINIVRNHPNLTSRKKAVGIYRLYTRRINQLNENISRGLYGIYMLMENKDIIVQRWKTERDSLQKLADQEIEPYLTATERKVRAMLSNPAEVRRMQEAARQQVERERRSREDAEKLRDIIR
jgi:hypothetical protein